jgi:hypothetical protein
LNRSVKAAPGRYRVLRFAAAAAAAGLALVGHAQSQPVPLQGPQPGDLVAGPGTGGVGATLRFVTEKGSVGFAVPGDWPTASMQPRPPVAMAVFQIPNPADAGTRDSTNVAFGLFDLDDPNAQAARNQVGQAYGPTPPAKQAYGGWTIYRQVATQGSTTYTILDGARDFPQLSAAAGVRLAWPHLAKNAPGYDADMERLYRSLLDAVSAAPGPYSPRPGEIVRRPPPAGGG